MAEGTIEIEYQLTLDDYASYSAVLSCDYVREVPLKKRLLDSLKTMALVALVILFVTIFFESLSPDYTLDELKEGVLFYLTTTVPFMFVVFMLVTLIMTYLPMKAFQYKRMKACCLDMYERGKNLMLLAPSTLRLNAEGVVHNTDYSESLIKWSGVEKVEVRDGNLYILNSTVSGYYVPERFFASREEVEEIARKCSSWFEQVQVSDDE